MKYALVPIVSSFHPEQLISGKEDAANNFCSWVSRAALVCENIGLKQVTGESDEKHDMNDVGENSMIEMEGKNA